MRTRSQSYLPSPPTSSPPPLSASRKRARSRVSDVTPTTDSDQPILASSPTQSSPVSDTGDAVQTPRKTKRVRFSDPGLSDVDALGISSTGLTPSFRKSCLSGDASNPRRRTLPPRLEHSSSSPPPPAEPLQFLPLRQVLDNRLRRRLRRNHLSEAVNAIEQEQRDEHKTQRELEQLRASGQHHEDTIRELQFELESQRQRGIAVNAEDDAERAALHDELQRLKFELLHHQDAPPLRERLAVGAPTEVATDIADDMLASPTRTSSPFDFGDDDFDAPSSPPAAAPDSPSTRLMKPTHTHAGVQTNLPDLIAERTLAAQSRLQTQLTRAQEDAASAHAAQHALQSDLAALGFAAPLAPASEHLASLRAAFREARLALERLTPGETPAGFAAAALLPALLAAAAPLGPLRAEHAALRANFDAALARANDLDARQTVLLARAADAQAREAALHAVAERRAGLIAERDARIDALEREAACARQEVERVRADVAGAQEDARGAREEAAHERTRTARLSSALSSYRDEVSSLESLVQRLESEKGETAAAHRERVSSLESLVQRLEAEKGEAAAQHGAVVQRLEGFAAVVEEAAGRIGGEVGGLRGAALEVLGRV